MESSLQTKISISICADQLTSCARLKNAEALIREDNSTDTFLVVDCHVLCDFEQLKQLVETHHKKAKMATMMYTYAEDPSSLRVVELASDKTNGLAVSY